MKIKRVCAWCKRPLDRKSAEASANVPVTHGICTWCLNDLSDETGPSLVEYLNVFSAPVLLINAAGHVSAGNSAAQEKLNKTLSEMSGYPGGEVFECVNAKLPEGCGYTIHCQACTIRRVVMKTMATGRAYHRIPAALRTGEGEAHYYISTEKAADFVLLQVEEVAQETSTRYGRSIL